METKEIEEVQEYLRYIGVPEELIKTINTYEEADELVLKLLHYSRLL